MRVCVCVFYTTSHRGLCSTKHNLRNLSLTRPTDGCRDSTYKGQLRSVSVTKDDKTEPIVAPRCLQTGTQTGPRCPRPPSHATCRDPRPAPPSPSAQTNSGLRPVLIAGPSSTAHHIFLHLLRYFLRVHIKCPCFLASFFVIFPPTPHPSSCRDLSSP